ncbi:MAG: RluA family pseudouridine synthase [Clostridia bacterium]|nr:RluA family pseudouridine synthase [Clostridia bacterium]
MPEIVYEDNHLLVAVKPPNQLTQGDETGDLSLLDELKGYIKIKYQKPGEVYLGLVHRLDRPVGGLVAFARTSKAASRLSDQVRTHAMHRDYLAVVENGDTLPDEGTLHNWLSKEEVGSNVRVVKNNTNGSQEARLHYRVLARRNGTALVHVVLETGRKHQIRVQFMHSGHPLVFDMRYGHGERGQNIALWGSMLTLAHPTLKESMTFFSRPRGAAFEPYADVIDSFLNTIPKGETK